MPFSAPAGYLDVTNATLRGSQIVTTGYVGVANANPVNHLSVGSNLHVNDTASNVLQVSGNVSADRFILGGISIEPTFDLESVTNVGNVTPYTVEFRNDTTGFMTTSNVEVGTANLFVDTTTGRVGVGTGSPQEKLDVRGPTVHPVVSYAFNQDAPYLIAAGTTYNGTSTNWATEGIQHRIKTSSGGVPRVTIDTPQSGEVFSLTNDGKVGIGTNNPGRPLEIYTGNGAIPGVRLRRYPTGATYTDLQHADPSSPANSAEGLAITVGDGNATTREVMRVCGDGNVIKQYQSACRVSFNNTNWTLGSGSTSILVYNYELYDINNDYNTSTGKFTCPHTGRYLAFHVLTGRNSRYTASIVEAKIFHNGSEVNRQFIGYGEGNYNATASCIISASKNDTINAGMWNGDSSNDFNGNNEGGGSQFIVYFLG